MQSVAPERVLFLGLESGDDIIVSFAIAQSEPGAVVSLILHRSIKYEDLLPPEEQGVRVSHEGYPVENREFLQQISWTATEVAVESTVRVYLLDISSVDPAEVHEAKQLLTQMKRGRNFKLTFL